MRVSECSSASAPARPPSVACAASWSRRSIGIDDAALAHFALAVNVLEHWTISVRRNVS